jgi:hypothetical protein
VILEAAATTVGGQSFIDMPSDIARRFARPGLYTAPIDGGEFRILSGHVRGGSLVAGTSLDQVTQTTGQIEDLVTYGSVAVVLVIGLGVFAVACARSRRWPGRPPGSPAATSPAAWPRMTPVVRWAGLARP